MSTVSEVLFSHLKQVLCALPQVLGKHWRVEGLALILQQPALVAGLFCGQIFKVWSSVTLQGDIHKHVHVSNATDLNLAVFNTWSK